MNHIDLSCTIAILAKNIVGSSMAIFHERTPERIHQVVRPIGMML
jgi:hypothetical protein